MKRILQKSLHKVDYDELHRKLVFWCNGMPCKITPAYPPKKRGRKTTKFFVTIKI